MTPEEARLNLDATTLRPQDTAEEARALASVDSELGKWAEGRRHFDEQVASAMSALPVPDDLRAKLLALEHQEAPKAPPARRRLDVWLTTIAAMAVVAVGSVVLWNDLGGRGSMPDWQKQSFALVRQIDSGAMPLDHFSSNLDEIRSMLTKNERPVPSSLPRGVEAMRSLGCKTVHLGPREMTVVCFEIIPGKEAHLVVVDNSRGDLPGAPPQRRPEFMQKDGWNVARWSDGGQCYFIATRAPRNALEKLFALLLM